MLAATNWTHKTDAADVAAVAVVGVALQVKQRTGFHDVIVPSSDWCLVVPNLLVHVHCWLMHSVVVSLLHHGTAPFRARGQTKRETNLDRAVQTSQVRKTAADVTAAVAAAVTAVAVNAAVTALAADVTAVTAPAADVTAAVGAAVDMWPVKHLTRHHGAIVE